MKYNSRDDIEFLKEIRETILYENLAQLSMGTMFFHDADVIITDDVEEEFIRNDKSEIIVETPHAQELSWLFHKLQKEMADTMSGYHREEFFGLLAEAANAFTARSDDRTGLLTAVLLQAAMMVSDQKQIRCGQIRDEVLSCVGSLSDLAEKI